MKKCVLILLALMMLSDVGCVFAEDADIYGLPNKSSHLTDGLLVAEVSKMAQITGEDSANKTQSRFNVWGTDLGSMTEMEGIVYMFCGDTFSTKDSDDWRSNVLFLIEDDDPSNGLTITGTIEDKWGRSKELLISRKIDNIQITIIPTNIFAIGDTLYCVYMSVKHWLPQGGMWECGYSGLAKSEDKGQTWQKLNNVQWQGDSNFCQTANCLVGDTMYIWGIPSGRYGGVALMKVPVDGLEDFEAYSYYTGNDENGKPVWVKGSEGIYRAKAIINAPVGEISVIYNEYLGNFIMTYLHEGRGIVMREGVMPWGEWGGEVMLASGTKYASLYGGFMCDKYVENDGQTFYFAMSQFFPIYNIMWMKAELTIE
ncbi:MAG: DUF4185 domain-containing protein [Oscillospiraceae bacterium]|jgi:hypothetical protein|nr:DUF4185 domain-containing protein [Oscillospiraceae bacterium]